jgi:hypothetical protein
MEIRQRLIAWAGLFYIAVLLLPAQGNAAEAADKNTDTALQLEVIDPYAELRTGPGRGYPVSYAVEQGETIELLTQRPGWYQVRAATGRTGWTSTAELSRTMQASGVPADLPSVSFGDYLRRSWQLGMQAGRFTSGDLDGADTFSATAGYKVFGWLELGLELGKFFGNEVRGEFYGFNGLVEPFSESRLSPFLALGVGKMNLDSQPKLVPLEIDSSDYRTYSIGTHYYLGRNFVIQGSYRRFVVDTDVDTERLGAWSLGFNAFF